MASRRAAQHCRRRGNHSSMRRGIVPHQESQPGDTQPQAGMPPAKARRAGKRKG
jgi:hypothetical protein